jgi:hypothetical protein
VYVRTCFGAGGCKNKIGDPRGGGWVGQRLKTDQGQKQMFFF